jgi:hypothetical protein
LAQSESLRELLRDPPPPSNFPSLCPPNRAVRKAIERLNQGLFEPKGLHKIPYLTFLPEGREPPVYDGETWPDTEAALAKQIEMMADSDEEVVDISTHSAVRQALDTEEKVVSANDAHMGAATALLKGIKYPIELRLLPHILREWRRQGLKVTQVNSLRLAHLASSLDDFEILFQLGNTDTFGIYYDLDAIREIVRGMAKRAIQDIDESETLEQISTEVTPEVSNEPTSESSNESTAESTTESDNELDKQKAKDFDVKRYSLTPMNFLYTIPRLLQFSAEVTPSDLFKDPFIAGTQLWVFMYRFLNNDKHHTFKGINELTEFAENLVEGMAGMQIGLRRSRFETDKDYALALRSNIIGYLPLYSALQRYSEIILMPYRACYSELKSVDVKNSNAIQTKVALEQFLEHQMFIPKDPHTFKFGEVNRSAAEKWFDLNILLRRELRLTNGTIKLDGLSNWQGALFRRFVSPPKDSSSVLLEQKGKLTEGQGQSYQDYCLPLYVQVAYGMLEKQMVEWRKIMGKYGQVIPKDWDLQPLNLGEIKQVKS